jgi:RimJ/RimL family protein N-acetyltransferase
MEVVRLEDPRGFLELAGAWLRRDEARNQLALGIAASAAAGRLGFLPFRGWVVLDEGPSAAAARTAPRNVILADPATETALAALVEAIGSDLRDAPGVVGNVPGVEAFAERWSGITGDRVSTTLRQGVFALEHVVEPERPAGLAEPARLADLDVLVRWWLAFEAEALPDDRTGDGPDAHTVEEVRRGIEERLAGGDNGVWVWRIDGEPVSTSGYAGPTGTGIRIGPVYTPPEHRRRGYASALVADLSAGLLANGFERCFLYTDLANPTANRIYEAIGYRRVAESRMLAFDR